VIYLDSSVALAAAFAETRQPSPLFWRQDLISSRLLEYEVMNRINARALGPAAINIARGILDGANLLELSPAVLIRALQPFPVPLRTLDALHLATMDFLRSHGQSVAIATYDQRLGLAAQALGFPLAET
jgi:predicted nucleic acid-binding protein